MTRPNLYRVDIGEDCYIGTADEVVAFMRKADGAPDGTRDDYMRGVAQRVAELTSRGPIDTSSAAAFLESLAANGIARVSVGDAPSDERADPADVLKDGYAYGPDVDPRDLDL